MTVVAVDVAAAIFGGFVAGEFDGVVDAEGGGMIVGCCFVDFLGSG